MNGNRRKLRPLVITMGGDRQDYIEKMFAQPSISEYFENPTFIKGIESRSLKSRYRFLKTAYDIGLLPQGEWLAIQKAHESGEYNEKPEKFFDCLKDIPISERRGSEWDMKRHYSVELWHKARGVNRGRTVLACAFAHLLCMKQFCSIDMDENNDDEEYYKYDFILEDNVRMFLDGEECFNRIWDTIEASNHLQKEKSFQDGTDAGEKDNRCHLRYYGWLGSIPNLNWVLNTHAKRLRYEYQNGTIDRQSYNSNDTPGATVFPFPIPDDFDKDDDNDDDHDDVDNNVSSKTHCNSSSKSQKNQGVPHTKPGGTPIWGAYAYWVSRAGYARLLEALRNDVGALLWKGKRMRCYTVKPIDKIIPRQIMSNSSSATKHDRSCIHVSTKPTFFRAPMLTSKIHSKWDPEFCKSTQYQLSQISSPSSSFDNFDSLWLSSDELDVVDYYKKENVWVTKLKLKEMSKQTEDEMNPTTEVTRDD